LSCGIVYHVCLVHNYGFLPGHPGKPEVGVAFTLISVTFVITGWNVTLLVQELQEL